MSESRVDVKVLVVRIPVLNVEFSIKEDMRRMIIDLEYVILLNRENLSAHGETMRPQHTAHEYLDIHVIERSLPGENIY
jgi:hypothetical protein